jgi:hypothetical protein
MPRKKCKSCLGCFNLVWIDNKRYYHCYLCNTWYSGRDDNLIQESNPYEGRNEPIILEEQDDNNNNVDSVGS